MGGAGYLQEHFGSRVIMGAEDWALLERTQGGWLKARRDMVANRRPAIDPRRHDDHVVGSFSLARMEDHRQQLRPADLLALGSCIMS